MASVSLKKKLVQGGSVTPERWLRDARMYQKGMLSVKANILPGKMRPVDYEKDFTHPESIYGAHNPPAEYNLDTLKTIFPPKDQVPVSFIIPAGGFGGRLFGYDIPENERIKIMAPIIGRISVSPNQVKAHPDLEKLLDKKIIRRTIENENLAEWAGPQPFSQNIVFKETEFVRGLWDIEQWRLSSPLFLDEHGKRRSYLTPLEIRLHYIYALKEEDYKIFPSIMVNDLTENKVRDHLRSIAKICGVSPKYVDDFVQVGLPRFIPHPEDLARDGKFKEYMKKIGINIDNHSAVLAAAKTVVHSLGEPGQILVDNTGVITRKPPGHMDGFTLYILKQLKEDLKRGVKIALFNNGEEIGFIYNPDLVDHMMGSDKILTFIFYKGGKGGGTAVQRYKDDGVTPEKPMLQVVEGNQLGEVHHKELGNIYTKNVVQVAINIDKALEFLGTPLNKFMAMSEEEIRALLDKKIYGKINPCVEIKPVDPAAGAWAAQLVRMFGQLSTIIPSEFILGDQETFPSPELKVLDSVPEVNAFAMNFYGKFFS
jgi:hypothetical protein